jgi:hypothetical protein
MDTFWNLNLFTLTPGDLLLEKKIKTFHSKYIELYLMHKDLKPHKTPRLKSLNQTKIPEQNTFTAPKLASDIS